MDRSGVAGLRVNNRGPFNVSHIASIPCFDNTTRKDLRGIEGIQHA